MNADNHFPPPVPIPLPEEANVQPVEPPTGLPESPPAFDFLDLTSDPTYPPPEAYAEPNVPVVESEPVPPALGGVITTTNPLTLPEVAPGTILPQTSSVALDERSLSLAQVLRGLHQRGRLLPLLREAAVAHLLQEQAASLGLSVTTAELQQAADDFRRRIGLTSDQDTQAWLARQRLSVQDFEAALERDLLVEKLKDHLTRDRIAGHFAAHQDGYARARLRQIVVAREDLARELLSQLQERRDFAQLARQHSQHPSGSEGGAVGEVFRRQFPAEIADAVFAARPGEVVGPLATSQGFLLLLVEEVWLAELDLQTTAAIRQELFEKWLNEQLKTVTITYPLLDNL